jgi:hypothetical protein
MSPRKKTKCAHKVWEPVAADEPRRCADCGHELTHKEVMARLEPARNAASPVPDDEYGILTILHDEDDPSVLRNHLRRVLTANHNLRMQSREIDSERSRIRSDALVIVEKAKMLLNSTGECIEKSKAFPIYLADLAAEIRALQMAAAQDAALQRLKPPK